MIDIKIVNNERELSSFPVDQSIKLTVDKELDKDRLSEYIYLFRLLSNTDLIGLTPPYNYTVGYIKEKFDTEELIFSLLDSSLTIKPKTPLHTNSKYLLFVSSSLPTKTFNIVKVNSKSKSSISVEGKIGNIPTINVKVKTTSNLANNTNIVVFTINSVDYSVNIKLNNKININGIFIKFNDEVYVKDEEFIVNSYSEESLGESLCVSITTAQSETIKPIEQSNQSTLISNSAILDFYKTLNTPTNKFKSDVSYAGLNTFIIDIPEGYSIDVGSTFLFNIKEAFNNYMLSSLELYNPAFTYDISITEEDSKLLVEVFYKEDKSSSKIFFNGDEVQAEIRKVGL